MLSNILANKPFNHNTRTARVGGDKRRDWPQNSFYLVPVTLHLVVSRVFLLKKQSVLFYYGTHLYKRVLGIKWNVFEISKILKKYIVLARPQGLNPVFRFFLSYKTIGERQW